MAKPMIKLNTIKPNPSNPRTIEPEQLEKLKKSITEFPKMMELRPMVVDAEGYVLGGNMRLKALKELGYKEVPDEWVKRAEELTEDERRRFIIADNVGFGEWDYELLANEWEPELLMDWGLELPGVDLEPDGLGDDFTLPDGEKEGLQQITFTLADEQITLLKNALETIKKTQEFKYVETYGNENGNGNALYLMVTQWEGQKR